MITRCIVGRGVTGATNYILGEGRDAESGELVGLAPGAKSRVDWFSGTGFGFDIVSREDADLARRIMEFDALNQSSRTRLCEKDCVHIAIGWRPGQNPTRQEMEAAALDALKSLGMGNAKAIFASHNDESYAHIHIVASKINPATGRAFDLRGNFLTLSTWAEDYERAHGGVVCIRRADANRLRAAITARDAGAVLACMTEQRPTFTKDDLDRALFKQIKNMDARGQFAGQVMDHPEIVNLADQPNGPVTRYTTRTVLAAEQSVLQAASALATDRTHDVGETTRVSVLRRDQFATIRFEQGRAYRDATGPAGLALIDGQAGTGKSFTIAAIRQAYEEGGCRVIGLAPTNAVAMDMHNDGFKQAVTIHSEIFRLNNGRAFWDRRTVIIVDEAAMVDTKLMATVTTRAQAAGAKLILVGDDRQLSSIERGGMFATLKERHGASALTEVSRQRKDDDKRASSMMAEGNFHDALTMYEAKGAIRWTRNQDQARAALVKAWAADTLGEPNKTRFVFAYTNIDVAELNADLRSVRKARGELGPDCILPTAEGNQPFARGDRLQLTGTSKQAGLYNGMTGTVQEIEGTKITFKLDGRREQIRTFDAAQFPNFRHGYAGTIYRGQGRTLDHSYLYHSEHWRSAASYVALTRHRDKAQLFVATNTAKDVRQLARQMARVDDRRAASHFFQLNEGGGNKDSQETGRFELRPGTDNVPSAAASGTNQHDHQNTRPWVASIDAGMVAQQQEARAFASRTAARMAEQQHRSTVPAPQPSKAQSVTPAPTPEPPPQPPQQKTSAPQFVPPPIARQSAPTPAPPRPVESQPEPPPPAPQPPQKTFTSPWAQQPPPQTVARAQPITPAPPFVPSPIVRQPVPPAPTRPLASQPAPMPTPSHSVALASQPTQKTFASPWAQQQAPQTMVKPQPVAPAPTPKPQPQPPLQKALAPPFVTTPIVRQPAPTPAISRPPAPTPQPTQKPSFTPPLVQQQAPQQATPQPEPEKKPEVDERTRQFMAQLERNFTRDDKGDRSR